MYRWGRRAYQGRVDVCRQKHSRRRNDLFSPVDLSQRCHYIKYMCGYVQVTLDEPFGQVSSNPPITQINPGFKADTACDMWGPADRLHFSQSAEPELSTD